MEIGVLINFVLLCLWCIMAAVVGLTAMLPAIIISGLATLVFAIMAAG